MPFNFLPDVDPDRLRLAVSALAGGFVYGLFNLLTLAMAGRPLTWADYRRPLLGMLGAMVCGAVVAFFVGGVLASLIPVEALRDLAAVGFAIGAFGWELAPFVLAFVRRRAAEKAGAQESV